MTSYEDFDEIRPYSDAETVEAMFRIASNPLAPVISKYLFPNENSDFLSESLRKVDSVSCFQEQIMSNAVISVIAKTSEGFTWSGEENLKLNGGNFVAVSNHRDIVLDPALFLYVLYDIKQLGCELCVGNNLLQNKFIEDMMRSNRMIKVIRGISARELYLSSQRLSKYIRSRVSTGKGSVWIAQREGRTKDGVDTTEQGILKMFELSGEKSFEENFKELNIVPISISYEYEPCDARKAREILIKKETGSYEKRPGEDTHSILTGIRQRKGHIHLTIGKPLTDKEINDCAKYAGNERYHAMMNILDQRIRGGYKLWKTNYIAHDMMNSESKYLGIKYLPQDLTDFESYINHKLSKLENKLDRDKLRDIFLHIYGNPVDSIV